MPKVGDSFMLCAAFFLRHSFQRESSSGHKAKNSHREANCLQQRPAWCMRSMLILSSTGTGFHHKFYYKHMDRGSLVGHPAVKRLEEIDGVVGPSEIATGRKKRTAGQELHVVPHVRLPSVQLYVASISRLWSCTSSIV